jgi:hypothetical protein
MQTPYLKLGTNGPSASNVYDFGHGPVEENEHNLNFSILDQQAATSDARIAALESLAGTSGSFIDCGTF